MHVRLRGRGYVNAMAASGGLEPTCDGAGLTVETIDHIYLSAAAAPWLRAAWVVRGAGFRTDSPAEWVHSDHLPVVCEIELPLSPRGARL